MGRNYFSKYGGPCFINNGLTAHHDHEENDSKDTGSDKALLLSLLVSVPIVLITLYALVISF
jgi:hypothetical protein